MIHVYLSTACFHAVHDDRPDLHTYCQSMTGLSGAKRPGTCKWCSARCICECHIEQRAETIGRP